MARQALYTLLKSLCQTLDLLVTTSPSICPAEPASDSPWPRAEIQAFPCRSRAGELPKRSPAAAGTHNQTQGCFRLKLKVEFPAQGITWHRYSQLFPGFREEAFSDFSELNMNFFPQLVAGMGDYCPV